MSSDKNKPVISEKGTVNNKLHSALKKDLEKLNEIYQRVKKLDESHIKEAQALGADFLEDTEDGQKFIEWSGELSYCEMDLLFSIRHLEEYLKPLK